MYFGSHSAIPPFRLERPATVAAALKAKAAAGRRGAYLAGGVDLVPALRARRIEADTVIDLSRIAALHRIAVGAKSIRLGALVTYRAVEADTRIAAALPELAELWRDVANIRTRHAATLGGNLMAGEPAYDLAPALIALDARLVFATIKRGQPVESTAEVFETSPKGALLAAIDIPRIAGRRFAMDRSLKPAVSVAVGIAPRDGATAVRAACGCAFERVAWSYAVAPPGGSAREIAAAIVGVLPPARNDAIASADYRKRMIEVLLARKLATLGLPE